MAKKRSSLQSSGEAISRSQAHIRVIEPEPLPFSYQEKYRSCKRKIKQLEQGTEESMHLLEEAKSEILRLRKISSKYLTELANRELLEESDSSDYSGYPITPSPRDRKTLASPRGSKGSQPVSRSSSAQEVSKPKAKADVTKPRRVQPIPKDENDQFIVPVQVGIFTILSLGKVDYRRPSFHTNRYIYPIGFKIQRYYKSTVHKNVQACYTLTILDADQGPKFEIFADDRPGEPFISETSSGAWSQIIKLSNQVRQLKITNSGSGPEFTGFSHPTISWMIQCLPNANLCSDYRWQDFEVMPAYQVPTRKWDAPPLPSTISETPAKPSTIKVELPSDEDNNPPSQDLYDASLTEADSKAVYNQNNYSSYESDQDA